MLAFSPMRIHTGQKLYPNNFMAIKSAQTGNSILFVRAEALPQTAQQSLTLRALVKWLEKV